jgi:hypothetical protein
VARRTMTLRRIDPWSVLKFGFVLNLCFFVVFLLGFAILWFIIGQLGIIEQACQLAEDVGFEDCGVDTGALFRVVMLIGGLAAVIMTGLAVFGAFLHNLLADLVGGIQITLTDESSPRASVMRAPADRRPTEQRGGPPPTQATRPAGGAQQGGSQGGEETRWTLGSPPPHPDEPGQGRTERVGGPTPGGSDRDDLFGGRDERDA